MAQVPFYVMIGAEPIMGGAQPDLAPNPQPFWGQFMSKADFSRVIPSGSDGTGIVPFFPSFQPQWDGSLNGGNGAFCLYSYVVGLHGNGDNWFWQPTSANGVTGFKNCITPYTKWMAGLWRRHQLGFKSLKFAVPGSGYGTHSGGGLWSAGGAAYALFKTQWDRAVAAMAAVGDTPIVKAVVTDASFGDIVGHNANYLANLRSHIDQLISDLNPEKIVVVTHRTDFMLGNHPGWAVSVATAHSQLPTLYPGVVYPFNMNWAKFGSDGWVGGVFPGPNNTTYETEDYVEWGDKLARFIDAIFTQSSTAVPSPTLAAHIILSDSMLLAGNMRAESVLFSGQGSLLGQTNGSTQMDGAYIFNGVSDTVEVYDVLYNAATMGSVGPTWGAELTSMRAMLRDFPNGVLTFKLAIAGATLTSPLREAIMEGVRQKWNACKMAALRDLNRTLDCVGVTIHFGTNDSYFMPLAQQFVTAAPAYIDEVRSIFTTRADSELSVVWVEVAPHRDSGVPGGSLQGDPAARALVRSTIRSLEQSRTRVKALKDDGGKYELQKDPDNQHYGMEAVLKIGEDMWALHRSQLFDEGETEAVPTDAPSETATFIVEDGTGLADANSMCSVEFADTYIESLGNPSSWRLLSGAGKRDALRQASRWMTTRYTYSGDRKRRDQQMSWPRVGVYDADGYYVPDNEVPLAVKRATAVVAQRIAKGDWVPFPDVVPTVNSSESISVGPISISSSGGSTSTSPEVKLSLVAALLRGLLRSSAGRLKRG